MKAKYVCVGLCVTLISSLAACSREFSEGDVGGSNSLGGGTSTGAASGTGGERAGDPNDKTPPTIVSVEPADGATAVKEDAAVVITFSEPMDKARTTTAFQSADIAPGLSVLSWNNDGTVLTVTPNAPLPYATGTAPDIEALKFAFQVTTTAEDLAGNTLAKDFAASFQTLRRITQTLEAGTDKVQTGFSTAFSSAESLNVGDNTANSQIKTVVTFDLTPVPDGILEFETATFRGRQTSINGLPYSGLGNLLLEHTNVPVDQLGTGTPVAAFASPPLRGLGILSNSAALEDKSTDVLPAVQDDYAMRGERANRSQYRAYFAAASDSDAKIDWVVFSLDPNSNGGPLKLELVYLIP